MLKYGHSKFSLEILEYCRPEDVIKVEQKYINLLQPEYNILKVAGSTLGYIHTEEAKKKKKIKAEHYQKKICRKLETGF